MLQRLFFNAVSATYDLLTNQSVWREQVTEVLNVVPDPDKIERVLDVGCGPGVSAFVLAEKLPHARVDGVDLAEKMIVRAKRHHAESYPQLDRVAFHVGDATQLAWPAETFDLVVGHSFLYLVPDPQEVLAQIRRVLRPGGTLVLLEPNLAGSLRSASSRRFERELGQHDSTDVARFGMSMIAWRVVSGQAGRLEPMTVWRWLVDAGFEEAEILPTLGGLGMHCIGRVESTP